MGVDRAVENERTLVWVAPNWILGELGILAEVADDALAMKLWRAVARVRLWALPGDDPQSLFARRVGTSENRSTAVQATHPEILIPLGVIDRLDGVDDPPTSREIVLACRKIATWAERNGLYETGMQFTEAAAMVAPDDPRLANDAGRICRRAGNRPRAELWYARAIGLARGAQNKKEYSSGYLGLAAVLRDGGEHYAALRLIRRAGNAARRAGLRGKAAEAYQDALGVATLHGHITRAIHFAHRALHVYPVHHSRLPAFSHDFAFLLVTRGLYSSALLILPLALRQIHRPTERLVALGTQARAAGGAMKPAAFWEALGEIRQLAYLHPSTGVGAMYSAGEGARLMELWDDAASLADEAIEMATSNDDPVIWKLATDLANEVRDRVAGTEACPEDDAEGRYLRALAADLHLRLTRWRGPTWRPRRRGEEPEGD